MSLRDDFEKEWPDFNLTRDSTGSYVDLAVENFWQAYQAATERALRILRCELPISRVKDQDEIWNALAVAHERIKGES